MRSDPRKHANRLATRLTCDRFSSYCKPVARLRPSRRSPHAHATWRHHWRHTNPGTCDRWYLRRCSAWRPCVEKRPVTVAGLNSTRRRRQWRIFRPADSACRRFPWNSSRRRATSRRNEAAWRQIQLLRREAEPDRMATAIRTERLDGGKRKEWETGKERGKDVNAAPHARRWQLGAAVTKETRGAWQKTRRILTGRRRTTASTSRRQRDSVSAARAAECRARRRRSNPGGPLAASPTSSVTTRWLLITTRGRLPAARIRATGRPPSGRYSRRQEGDPGVRRQAPAVGATPSNDGLQIGK